MLRVWASNEKGFTTKILAGKDPLHPIEISVIALLHARLDNRMNNGITLAKIEEAVTAALESFATSSGIKITLE